MVNALLGSYVLFWAWLRIKPIEPEPGHTGGGKSSYEIKAPTIAAFVSYKTPLIPKHVWPIFI